MCFQVRDGLWLRRVLRGFLCGFDRLGREFVERANAAGGQIRRVSFLWVGQAKAGAVAWMAGVTMAEDRAIFAF
jgi:hypothetical protein